LRGAIFKLFDPFTPLRGGGGCYRITFKYKVGLHALAIKSCKLYDRDTLISADIHLGRAGHENEDNTYFVEVSDEQIDFYSDFILEAEVSGIGGNDSEGSIEIEKCQSTDPCRTVSGELPWSLEETTDPMQLLIWNTTGNINEGGAGWYRVTFKYESGVNALVMLSCKLYSGDILISEDIHSGRTGYESENNSYFIEVTEEQMDVYADFMLKAEVSGDGGNDSNGIIEIEKVSGVLSWSLEDTTDETQLLIWNITGNVNQGGAGRYRVTLKYESGIHALLINSCKLYSGDILISEDVHSGRTGHESENNSYFIDITQEQVGLYTDFVLKAEVSGDGGNDSQGTIEIEKI